MIGDTIRKYRKANQMSQDDLAEKLNVTRQSISLWENGQTQPSLDSIVALAKLFNVSTDVLLTEGENDVSEGEERCFVTEPTAAEKKKLPLIPILICGAVLLMVGLFFLLRGLGKEDTPLQASTSPTATSTATQAGTTAAVTEKTGVTETATVTTASKKVAAVTTVAMSGDDTPAAAPAKTQKAAATTAKKTAKKTQAATKPTAKKNFYSELKSFVLKNGDTSGNATFFIRSSSVYGGSASENFNLTYWANTDDMSFCLHCPIDAEYVMNVYIFVPKSGSSYTYTSSYCYQSGESILEANGTLPAGEFTSNYPLPCSSYYGGEASRISFMEESRKAVCDLLSCVENFLSAEGLGYSMSDIGFKSF